MSARVSLVLVAALLLVAPRAAALELGAEDGLTSVDVHAFASQGFILTKSNNYLDNDTTHGSFQFSEIGINFTKTLTDRMRIGVQLFAQDLGPTGSYDAKVDWFYVDYRFADWFGVRTGRVKIPFGLYNEVNDIDSARVPILLPQSVYPEQDRNFLLAQTGAEIYGYLRLRPLGALEYRLYGGTIFLDTTNTAGSPLQVLSFNVPYLAGGRLMWETPIDGLRLGGSLQDLRLDATVALQAMQATVQIPAVLSVGSVEYASGNLLLAAEYSRWDTRTNSNNAMVFPPSPEVSSERAYGMASYRVARWLQPGVYYSVLFPDVTKLEGRENMQHDVATTLRFDINEHWLFKVEGHYMFGTAGLDSTLNDNVPLSALASSWGVFLLKTTGYF
jgi:hypothetical protein